MTTNWSEEKYEAATPAKRSAKKALRDNHESLAPRPTPKIDQPLIDCRDEESLPTAGFIHRKGRFLAGGLPVRCYHCRAEEFSEGSALLSTVGISFAHLNWTTEKKVTNLMCDNCGLIQWFGAAPQRR